MSMRPYIITMTTSEARQYHFQICRACLKCKSCDSSRVSKFVGSLPFCGSCFKLRQKGNYCPLCQACYRDNDFDSKVMCLCSRNPECTREASMKTLLTERYQYHIPVRRVFMLASLVLPYDA